MAGGIAISEGVGVVANSLGTSLIVERTRDQLVLLDAAVIPAIYESYDAGAFNILILRHADQHAFNLFYRATKKAYELRLAESGKQFDVWEDLIAKLEADPRWKPSA